MNNNIVETGRYLDDLGLVYIPEIDKSGVHIQGLARLLDCDPRLVQRAKQNCGVGDVLEARIETTTGLKTVAFILENGVIEILEQIIDSPRIKKETRQRAREIFKRFAKAGFRLYVMMQVAPEKLGMSPQSSPRKSFDDLSKTQLWALWLRQELLRYGRNPDPKMLDGIDPAFWGAPREVVRYAFRRRDLAEIEWLQPSYDEQLDCWGDRGTMVKNMRRRLNYLQDYRKHVEALEIDGAAKMLQDFEVAINGALVA
jgi:hypothetical protein